MFDRCPLCGCDLIYEDDLLRCKLCNYNLHNSIIQKSDNHETIERKRNAIYSWLIKKKGHRLENEYSFYCFDPFDDTMNNPNLDDNPYMINVEVLLKSYPKTLLQRIDAVLLNIVAIHNDMGAYFPLSGDNSLLMYCETDNYDNEISYVVQMMVQLGYIISTEDTLDESIYRCQITLSGWKRIEELNSLKTETNQAFIAMKFGDETIKIAKAIKKAISSMGYFPYKMDEIEHNKQIVPEMFYEISRSKLLVIDVSIPNLGAYYEAGYAQALGKEVIVCCKKSEEKKVHFDISQKNMILWESEEDLEIKLSRRIEATIGKA